jgi:hypothetical protein
MTFKKQFNHGEHGAHGDNQGIQEFSRIVMAAHSSTLPPVFPVRPVVKIRF